MRLDPLPLLGELVAANSINPSLVDGAPGEAAAGEVCRRAMERAGLEVTVQAVRGDRSNVIGVLNGRSAGPAVMFCGHLDTVGVAGMTDPFVPRVEGGRLYGRGAQDMKGGVAAMIAAAGALAPQWTRGRLVVAAVVDEEHESIGAEALVREWRADAAIITEPTDLAVAIAHKGFAWFDIETRGRAAHGSRPAEGRDAILRMGRVLGHLESLDRTLQAQPPHPLLGTSSLHASLIDGGQEASSYPERCRLQIERRTLPGETGSAGLDEVRAILERLRGEDSEFAADATLVFGRDAYEINPSHRLPEMLAHAAASVGCAPRRVGMSFWSDAAILSAAGIPSVLFGPGGAGLHSTEEYVKIEEVCVCRDALVALAREFTQSSQATRR